MKTWQKLKQHPEAWGKYLVRETVTDTIRKFFKERGFREMFTPILVPVPSVEANLEVFETQLRTATGKKRRGFLIMSPEYSLKKLLAAGAGNIFEITRSFRNEEEASGSHNPEFSILEWYRTNANYLMIMEDFEELFTKIVQVTRGDKGADKFTYQGQEYDLTRPWMRISVAEAFEKYAGIKTEAMLSETELMAEAKKRGYQVAENTTWEQVFYQIFFNEIETKLKAARRPVFVYDYPASQAALSRKKAEDPRFAERFEVYLAGLELGNCFSELTDAAEQSLRLEADVAERKRLGKTEYPADADLIAALKSGVPETAGIAVGVDRLVMLAADAAGISETLLFPGEEIFELGE